MTNFLFRYSTIEKSIYFTLRLVQFTIIIHIIIIYYVIYILKMFKQWI